MSTPAQIAVVVLTALVAVAVLSFISRESADCSTLSPGDTYRVFNCR